MTKPLKDHILIIVFCVIYFFVGILTFKDYGVGIEEHFQRSSGFYWFNYILQFTDFENLKFIVENKIIDLKKLNPHLPPVKESFDFYGIVFDLPAAAIETLFKIDKSQNYFYMRHFMIFIIFLLSGIAFYFILKNRFSNNLISFLGTIMYFLTPRIYGNSFFDGKDLFFLSIFTITLFFFYKFENKKNNLNLAFFALFCALSTSSRIIAITIPIAFTFLIFLELLNSREASKNIKNLFIFSFLYLFFLFIHWPYLWTLNLNELINFFDRFTVEVFIKVYFNGNFYDSTHLPINYLPLWILITTPIFYLLLFFTGYFFQLKRIFFRLIGIKEINLSNDFWCSKNEKFDVLLFFIFLQIIMLYLSTNITLYGGWRHFLFLNFFIIYYSSIAIYFYFIKFRKRKKIIKISLIIFSFFIAELIYKLNIYHPYQSVYFNNIAGENYKKLFEVDTQSLSRSDAIKDIIKDNKRNQKVIIGTASFTPLMEGRSMISQNNWNQLIFTGTANTAQADYIYTNHFYEVDIRYNKKYQIPDNFYLYKRHTVDNTVVYSIYKNYK